MNTISPDLNSQLNSDEKKSSVHETLLIKEEPKEEKKLLLWQSLLAGTIFGAIGFAQGTISELGIGYVLLYSSGSLLSGLIYQIFSALTQLKKTGSVWNIEDSTLVCVEDGRYKLRWGLLGLVLLRVGINFVVIWMGTLALDASIKAGIN